MPISDGFCVVNCDECDEETEVILELPSVLTVEEQARKRLWQRGWSESDNGTILCNECTKEVLSG